MSYSFPYFFFRLVLQIFRIRVLHIKQILKTRFRFQIKQYGWTRLSSVNRPLLILLFVLLTFFLYSRNVIMKHYSFQPVGIVKFINNRLKYFNNSLFADRYKHDYYYVTFTLILDCVIFINFFFFQTASTVVSAVSGYYSPFDFD